MDVQVTININDAFDNLKHNEQIYFFKQMFSNLASTDRSNFIRENIEMLHKDEAIELLHELTK